MDDKRTDEELAQEGLVRRADGKVVDAESEAERQHDMECERAFDRFLER